MLTTSKINSLKAKEKPYKVSDAHGSKGVGDTNRYGIFIENTTPPLFFMGAVETFEENIK